MWSRSFVFTEGLLSVSCYAWVSLFRHLTEGSLAQLYIISSAYNSYFIEDTRILHKDFKILTSVFCICIKFAQGKAMTPLGFLFELFICSSVPNYNYYLNSFHILKCSITWEHLFIVPVNQTVVLIS